MYTYFISDLHLSDQRPDLTELYLDFMQQAHQADALYILGDFFNFWIGDDEESETIKIVRESLLTLNTQGVPCYFIHGNRDFLLGEKYAQSCNLKILAEETVIDLYGTPTLLCHGDTLCLDDIKYQRFRKIVLLPWLQKLFLYLPLKLRIKIGHLIRKKSNIDKQKKSATIMDVATRHALQAFKKYKVTRIIHGHTHRQGIHYYTDPDNTNIQLTRIVLGDWGKTASILKVSKNDFCFNLERNIE